MASKPKVAKSVFGTDKPGSQGEAHTIWSSIDWTVVKHLVVVAARAGATVQLGVTQNGSAATLRLYHEGKGETFYAGDVVGMEDLCHYYAGAFEALLD